MAGSRPVLSEDRVELDAYYTPQDLADYLAWWLFQRIRVAHAAELHVGGGAWPRSLGRYAPGVTRWGCDLDPDAAGLVEVDRRIGSGVADALDLIPWTPRPGLVVGNPPFDGAEEHIRTALHLTGRHVFYLLPTGILHGEERRALWLAHRPRAVVPLLQRPSFTGDPLTGVGRTDGVDYHAIWWDTAHVGPTELHPPADWRRPDALAFTTARRKRRDQALEPRRVDLAA